MTATILEFRPRSTTPAPASTAAAMLAALPPDLAARYVVDGECLRWTGPTNGRQGYGLVIARTTTDDGRRVQAARMAHRVAYEAVHGPIPAGLVLDHFRVGTSARCIGNSCGVHVTPTTVRLNSLRPGSASPTRGQRREDRVRARRPPLRRCQHLPATGRLPRMPHLPRGTQAGRFTRRAEGSCVTRRDRTGEPLDEDAAQPVEQSGDRPRTLSAPRQQRPGRPSSGGEPCGDPSCGACRARALAMAFNRLTYGADDYPGQRAAAHRRAAA